MKTILTSLLCVLLLIPSLLSAQSFTLTITPDSQSVAIGGSAVYSIGIIPLNGFNQSVFLSATATTFGGSISFSSSAPNPPYSNISMIITPSIQDMGSISFSVKGKNGNVQTTDTCILSIRKNVQWSTMIAPQELEYIEPRSLKTDNNGDVCLVSYRNLFYQGADSIITSHFTNQKWKFNNFNPSLDADPSSYGNLSFAYDTKSILWLATQKGLLRYDGTFMTMFNKSNSGLSATAVSSVQIDRNGFPVCLAVGGSVAIVSRYNGSVWNSLSPRTPTYSDKVTWLPFFCIDSSNQLWIPTYGGGIIKMQDTVQENFHITGNPPIWANWVSDVVCDKDGGIWCRYPAESLTIALSYYDGITWKHIPSPTESFIKTMFVDSDKNVWLCSEKGLHWYNGTTWTTYDASNSPVPWDRKRGSKVQMLQDKNKNIWMLIGETFYIFNPNGLVDIPLAPLDVEEQPTTTDKITITPNPSNTTITISGTDAISAVTIVNSFGMEVAGRQTLSSANGSLNVDVSDLASGVYFIQLRTPTGMISKPIVVMH